MRTDPSYIDHICVLAVCGRKFLKSTTSFFALGLRVARKCRLTQTNVHSNYAGPKRPAIHLQVENVSQMSQGETKLAPLWVGRQANPFILFITEINGSTVAICTDLQCEFDCTQDKGLW